MNIVMRISSLKLEWILENVVGKGKENDKSELYGTPLLEDLQVKRWPSKAAATDRL